MLDRIVRVNNALGLHARAAAKLVRLANRFKSSITLIRSDTKVSADGKDILSILNLAAGLGIDLSIVAEGEDEADALAAIVKLFVDGFGEID